MPTRDIGIRQGGGRFVQDEHARVARQQACNLDQLALGDGERTDRPIEIPIAKTEHGKRLSGAHAELGAPMQEGDFGAAKPDVVEDRKMGSEAQLLCYHSEPQRLRMLGRTHPVDLPIYRDRTTVGLDDSHQNFDQGAFARTVLAADGANFTRSERKRDLPERLDPGIELADAVDR